MLAVNSTIHQRSNNAKFNELNIRLASGQFMASAVIGGGCFWCVEGAYKDMRGVESALPGYAGGHDPNPTYNSVCAGVTGHAEVVEIIYDSSIISYETILEVFFTVHDPTQLNRQGNDIGTQYRSCIFYVDQNQKLIAENVLEDFKQYFIDHENYLDDSIIFECK